MNPYGITVTGPHYPCGTTIRARKITRQIYDWLKWGHVTHKCSRRVQMTAHEGYHLCLCGFSWNHFSPFI